MTQVSKSHQCHFEIFNKWGICEPTHTFLEINHFLRYSTNDSKFIYSDGFADTLLSISEVVKVDFIQKKLRFKLIEEDYVFSLQHKNTKQILSIIIKNQLVILGCHYVSRADLPLTFQNDILNLVNTFFIN